MWLSLHFSDAATVGSKRYVDRVPPQVFNSILALCRGNLLGYYGNKYMYFFRFQLNPCFLRKHVPGIFVIMFCLERLS